MTKRPRQSVLESQAEALAAGFAALVRRIKLEEAPVASRLYGDLHINDLALIAVLAEPGEWTVRGLAQTTGAPIDHAPSALDRLEDRKLVVRKRQSADRRVMGVSLTDTGVKLVTSLRGERVERCCMLARLQPAERSEFIRPMTMVANEPNSC